MKVRLYGREAGSTIKRQPLIEAEIDCSKHHYIGPEIIRWRDMDFLYHDIEKGVARYVVPRWTTTVNFHPNETGEKWTG